MSLEDTTITPARLSTGIPGLDTVLAGGMMSGSVFIVQGPPGAGKTIFANQLCFHQAQLGRRALYITLLAESHDRLIQHLGDMEFFDPSKIPESIYYISGFDTLLAHGLPGILRLLRSESKAHGAKLLVLDGLFVLEETLQNDREFRKFINDLEILANLLECTVLLLTNSVHNGRVRPEYTMVDSWIELNSELKEYRAFRHLMVHKYRGSDFLAGRHVFTISNQGITVLPRLELVARRQPAPAGPGRLSTGCAELDGMLKGGLPHSSTTLIQGPTGVGKSIFGLHFISRSSAEEPGLVFGFYETPDRLALKAAALGLPLDDLVRSGALQILWHPPAESLLDQLACRLLECVHARGVKRLLIDGLDAFAATPIYPQRMGPFLSALTNELRDAGVTTVMTAETDQGNAGPGAPDLTLPLSSMSAVAENILLLRYREREARLQRTLTVVKVRESQFDHRVREFSIGSNGICFADRATDAGTSDPQA